MSFVDGFYSFNIKLNNCDNNIYEKIRLKTAKHPLEPLSHLAARVIAFCDCYKEDIKLSQGWFEKKEPDIFGKDILGEFFLWAAVGLPEKDKILKALKFHQNAKIFVYFYKLEDIFAFCHYLRGSKTNWAEGIHFRLIDSSLLDSIEESLTSSSNWELSIVDNTLYLVFDDLELESKITDIDIWKEYQESIKNISV